MTDVEDQLRDAYRALTGTITEQDVPGLYQRRPAATRRWMSTFAPLAAAAAVIVAVVASVTLPGLLRTSSAPPTASATAGGPPPYLLLLKLLQSGNLSQLGPAVVVSAATGAVTARVPVPLRGYSWADAAPTGSGTTFILAARPLPDTICTGTRLYTLKLSASGVPVSLAPRPYRGPVRIDTFTVSADGSTIGFTGYRCPVSNDSHEVVGVIRGGTVKLWDERIPEYTNTLSLSASGSKLAVVDRVSNGHTPVVLLDTGSAPGSVDASGRIVYTFPAGNSMENFAVLSPDGRALFVSGFDRPDLNAAGFVAGYHIGGGRLFYQMLPDGAPWRATAAGDQIFAQFSTGAFLVDPLTGTMTQYTKLPRGNWAYYW